MIRLGSLSFSRRVITRSAIAADPRGPKFTTAIGPLRSAPFHSGHSLSAIHRETSRLQGECSSNAIGQQIRTYSIASELISHPPTAGFDYHHLFAQCKDLLQLGKKDPNAALKEAETLLNQTKTQNVKLDLANYAALIQLFEECGEIEKGIHTLALEASDVLRLVDEIDERGLKPHPRVMTSLLSTLIMENHQQGFERVSRMATQMGMLTRSIDLVNVSITGAIQFKDPSLGLFLFSKARESRQMQPNQETLRGLLRICQMLNMPDRSLKLIEEFSERWNVKPDTLMFVQVLQTVLAEFSPDRFFKAEEVFRASGTEPNMEIWNMLVLGQGFYGSIDKAVSLMDEMRARGFQPDHSTLANVLAACFEVSDLDRALTVFRQWQADNGELKSGHFGVLLNLALKTKNKEKFEEIVRMVEGTPFSDDDLLRDLVVLNRDRLNRILKSSQMRR